MPTGSGVDFPQRLNRRQRRGKSTPDPLVVVEQFWPVGNVLSAAGLISAAVPPAQIDAAVEVSSEIVPAPGPIRGNARTVAMMKGASTDIIAIVGRVVRAVCPMSNALRAAGVHNGDRQGVGAAAGCSACRDRRARVRPRWPPLPSPPARTVQRQNSSSHPWRESSLSKWVSVELLIRQADVADEKLIGADRRGRLETERCGECHDIVLVNAVAADSEPGEDREA